jgi:hypothetical protein
VATPSFFFSQIKEKNLLSFPSTSWLIKKKGLGEKSHFKKKRSRPGLPGARVDQPGWPGLAGFLH